MKGVVERIAPQSAIKNNIKGYAARILINDIDHRVRPGMTANLSIPVVSSPNAVAVPLAAVFTEQRERYVYVQRGGEFEKCPVQIGITDYDFAEVINGLNGGETVSLEDKTKKPPSIPGAAQPSPSVASGKPATGGAGSGSKPGTGATKR